MDVSTYLLMRRLKKDPYGPDIATSVKDYVSKRRPVVATPSKAWSLFEEKCERLCKAVPSDAQSIVVSYITAGLQLRSSLSNLTPLGETLMTNCATLRRRLLQGGAAPKRVWTDLQSSQQQIQRAWSEKHPYVFAWLVLLGIRFDVSLCHVTIPSLIGAAHWAMPIVWATHISTKIVLSQLGITNNGETFLCQPITAIPPQDLFVCAKGIAFNVHEVLQYILAQGTFKHPNGHLLLSSEIAILCTHPRAVALGLSPWGFHVPRLQPPTVWQMFALAVGLSSGRINPFEDLLSDLLKKRGFLARWGARLTTKPATSLAIFFAFRDTLVPLERAALNAQSDSGYTLEQVVYDVSNYHTCVHWTGHCILRMFCKQANLHGTLFMREQALAQDILCLSQMHVRKLCCW